MKSIIFSFFFLCLTSVYSYAQTIDSTAVKKQVDSLLQVSLTYINKGDFNKALDINAAAGQIAREKLGVITVSNGACIHIRGLILYNKGDYAEAEKTFKEAIAVREKTRGKEHSDYLGSIINLAVIYKTTGKFEQAEALFLEAKETYEVKLKNFKHPFYINCLANLADLYMVTGAYEKSETIHLKVLEIRARELGKKHADYPKSLRNLGNVYLATQRYEKAEYYFKEAVEANKAIWGDQHYEYAACLFSLATLYIGSDEFDKAEPLLLKTQAIWRKVYGEEHSKYGVLLENMGNLYLKMGNYKKAEAVLLQAKSVFENSLGNDSPEYAGVLNSLSAIYDRSGELKKARQTSEECVAVTGKALGKEHPTYAQNVHNYAALCDNLWLDDTADSLYREALRIWEKTSGKESLDYAFGLSGLASHNVNTRKYREAEPLYLQALSIVEKNAGTEGQRYIDLLFETAILYEFLKRPSSTDSLLERVAQADKKDILKGLKFLSEFELDQYLHTFLKHQYRAYAFAQNRNSPSLVKTCYNNSLFYQGISLNATSKIKQLAARDSANSTVLQNLQALQRRLAAEYAYPLAERDTAQVALWEEQANALEKELVRNVAGYSEIFRQVHWQEVQQRLTPGEAAVELVRYEYFKPGPTDSIMYAALVLLPSDSSPHFIPLFEERQLSALFNKRGLDEQLTVKSLYGSRSELLPLLWKPLEPLLGNAKTIYYAPAGLLHRINPAALLDADKQPLSAGRQWVRLGSTRELVAGSLAERSFAHDAAAVPTAEVWGGIRYDMDSLALSAANPVDTTESDFQRKDGKFRYMLENTRGEDDGAWKDLEGSKQEAKKVDEQLRNAGFRCALRTGYMASEERFKTLGQTGTSPRILHIATHGFAYPDPKETSDQGLSGSEPVYKLQDDPMLRSGLLLAGANHYWLKHRPLQNREDGVLVAYEVRDLNLRNTELAVLSACQTGLGDVVGSEGVYGLQRAFRIAGTKFLIVSLWHVPDEQTRELMSYFYENWTVKRESLRDAFNHAQATLREQEPNPYLWAGFVLIE